jgi:hypothetical protein
MGDQDKRRGPVGKIFPGWRSAVAAVFMAAPTVGAAWAWWCGALGDVSSFVSPTILLGLTASLLLYAGFITAKLVAFQKAASTGPLGVVDWRLQSSWDIDVLLLRCERIRVRGLLTRAKAAPGDLETLRQFRGEVSAFVDEISRRFRDWDIEFYASVPGDYQNLDDTLNAISGYLIGARGTIGNRAK